MCDTILAMRGATGGRATLFGKNSDRQRNEAQLVEYIEGVRHGAGAATACTYLTIPQVQRTHAVLLCRPFWGWGAEMGANECGVVVGNEGLHARRPAPRTPALTGMDLVRLALERADTAARGVEVITDLLQQYGQGGNCGHIEPTYYNNGFIIADANEAFVLETVEREWLVERVHELRTISNKYSIGEAAGATSAGLAALIQQTERNAQDSMSFCELIADPNREHLGNAGARRARSTSLLQVRAEKLEVSDMLSVLRDHGCVGQDDGMWEAACFARRTLCMHAGARDKPGQTVGSMVSELYGDTAVHWVTGTAAPCISIFKPVLMDVPLPPHGPPPTDRFDHNAMWWRHERMHRAALLGDFAHFIAEISAERDLLEAQMRTYVHAVMNSDDSARRAGTIDECWQVAIEAEARWWTQVSRTTAGIDQDVFAAWQAMNVLAGLRTQ